MVAVDMDSVAIQGGPKQGVDGTVHMPGLLRRLDMEGLRQCATVLCRDFVTMDPVVPCDAVFTSGSIQYSHNMRHAVERILESIKAWVRPEGFLYLDYMIPFEEAHHGRPNFLQANQITGYFDPAEWRIWHHRTTPVLLERGHVDNPLDHYHKWGHLLLSRR